MKKDRDEDKNFCDKTIELSQKIFHSDINFKDDFNVINLEPLCRIHEKSKNNREKFILEELFHLCTNDGFIESIKNIRNILSKETDIKLPTLNENQVVISRNILFENNKWNNWYQPLLEDIRKKHRLFGEIYSENPLSDENYNFGYKANSYLIKNDTKNQNWTKKKFDKKAKDWTIDDALQDKLNCLECIIFFNNPIYKRGHMGLPHSNRGGFMTIEHDLETGEPYVNAKFYLNSTKSDMVKVVKRDYEKISKIRSENFSLKIKSRDDFKDKLLQRFRVFQLNKCGYSFEKIALEVQKEGLIDEMTEDNIHRILGGIKKENKKFDFKGTR